MAFLVAAILALLMLAGAEPAQAKRILGTKGPDRIVGTAKADVIKARAGNDRVRGRGGADRLWGGRGRDRIRGGRGADRLNAVDGRRDRAIRGGPGEDVCRVDRTDRVNVKGCETVKVRKPGGPGGGPGPEPGPGPGPDTGPGTGQNCAVPGGCPAHGRRSGRGARRKTSRRFSSLHAYETIRPRGRGLRQLDRNLPGHDLGAARGRRGTRRVRDRDHARRRGCSDGRRASSTGDAATTALAAGG